MVSRDDFDEALKLLHRSRIKPKTMFHNGPMAVLAFDTKQTGGDSMIEISEADVIKTLEDANIPVVSARGVDFEKEPITLDVGDQNLDSRMSGK